MLEVNKIEELIKGVLEDNEIANHSISIINESVKRLEICIAHKDGSMDLNCCEKVSREISELLNSIDQDEANYMLDVCSFGAEKELKNQQQVIDAVNQYIHVDLYNDLYQMNALEGTLISADENSLTLQHFIKGVKKTTAINKENIRKVRLAVKF